MSSTTAKPFRRITSLVKLRNRHQGTPYQAWEEDEQLDQPDSATVSNNNGQAVVEFPALSPTEPANEDQDKILGPTCVRPEHSLVECFYLGSANMSGLEIRGRGCIDRSAANIWEQTQDRKPKRKNSWPMRHQYDSAASNGFKPRYVKLVTGPSALQVHDNSSNQLITQFSYRKISFVGTHPKYTRLFAFIAEASETPTPFCHAFKCEDKDSAKQAACALSDLFNKKIQELLKSKIEVNADATLLP